MNIDVVTANLFLHHFMQEQLARLLAHVAQRTPLLVACEPRRTAPGLVASQLLWTIGCSDVTRHDAAVSVRAGFRGDELSELWSISSWVGICEDGAGLFTHCFVARRISGEIA